MIIKEYYRSKHNQNRIFWASFATLPKFMFHPQLTTLPSPEYMASQKELAWSMCGILLDWLVQVHARFRLLPETLFLCVNIIDWFLSARIVSDDTLHHLSIIHAANPEFCALVGSSTWSPWLLRVGFVDIAKYFVSSLLISTNVSYLCQVGDAGFRSSTMQSHINPSMSWLPRHAHPTSQTGGMHKLCVNLYCTLTSVPSSKSTTLVFQIHLSQPTILLTPDAPSSTSRLPRSPSCQPPSPLSVDADRDLHGLGWITATGTGMLRGV